MKNNEVNLYPGNLFCIQDMNNIFYFEIRKFKMDFEISFEKFSFLKFYFSQKIINIFFFSPFLFLFLWFCGFVILCGCDVGQRGGAGLG